MISMLHHVEDRRAAVAEARRILRPGGRLVLIGFTGEDAATLWILDYFPISRPWMEATHPPRSAFLIELPGSKLVVLGSRHGRRVPGRPFGRSRVRVGRG